MPIQTPPSPLPKGVPNPLLLAESAALAGAGAGGAALGDSAEKDRLTRSRGAGQTPVTPQEPKQGKGTAALGAPPEEEAKSVRNAEKYAARTAKPSGTPLMQPAAGTADGEGDTLHVRRYGVDSGDVFEDERLISPALIGEDDELPPQAD